MAAVSRPLEELRAEVDRIDQVIVELLIERTTVVRRIGAVKGDGADGRLAMRPAREAVILRRLVALAGDRFPAAVLIRMWRELLAHTTRLQVPVSVAVCATPGSLAIWDLARDHFGSSTPMMRVESASQALRAVGDGSATAYRARCRPPSFIHFAMFPQLIRGHTLSDVVAVLGSLNIIAAELDR
jgi:chorismate mutase/prephenate dehydratase